MKLKNLILILSILFNSSLHGAKTYTLSLKLIGINNYSMEGFKISTEIGEKILEVGLTDVNGEISIPNLSAKSLTIIVKDPNNLFLENSIYISNTDKKNLEKVIYLRLNYELENKVFEEIDARYNENKNNENPQTSISNNVDLKNDTNDTIPASFVGENGAFFRFIAMNVTYPQECIEKNIQGRVYLSFIIEKDGTITNVKVFKGVHESLDNEAIRVLRYSPKWIPSSVNGKAIRSVGKTPITFSLN